MKNKLKNTKTKLTHFKALLLALVVMFSALAPSIPMEAATKKVSISKEAVTMGIKETYQLKMKNTTKKVKWSSSNKSVATINNKGVITAKKKGTATITAKVSGKKYTCKVTVKKISISKSKVTVGVNDTYQLKMNHTVSKVKWTSSDKKIATVNSDGLVTAKKAGTATITAKANGKKYTCKVTVTKVKINTSDITIGHCDTYQLKMENTKDIVTWSSSNKKVATVNKNGKVTAKKAGTTTVTAKVNGKKYTCKVTVQKAKLSKKDMEIRVGSSKTLMMKNTTSKVKWSTSDKKIATVDKNGKVTAKAEGNVVITAEVNGTKFECKVTVLCKKVTVYIDFYDEIDGEKTYLHTIEYEAVEGEEIDTVMAYTHYDYITVVGEKFIAKEGARGECIYLYDTEGRDKITIYIDVYTWTKEDLLTLIDTIEVETYEGYVIDSEHYVEDVAKKHKIDLKDPELVVSTSRTSYQLTKDGDRIDITFNYGVTLDDEEEWEGFD